jgi:hypothetical protein
MRVRSSDATTRGHPLCSFLAPFVWTLLDDLTRDAGGKLEWRKMLRDLDRLSQVRSAVAVPTGSAQLRRVGAGDVVQTRQRRAADPHVRSVPGHLPNPNPPEDFAAAEAHATQI